MQGGKTPQLYLLPMASPRFDSDGVPMSDVSLSTTQRRSGVDGSKQVLGVLAAELMLDRAASLPLRCSVLLLLLLAVVCEGSQSISASESEDESEEKRRESVRPASATRRRLRSAVPSRLHAQLPDQVTWLRSIHACSMQQGLCHQEEGLLLQHPTGLYRSSHTC